MAVQVLTSGDLTKVATCWNASPFNTFGTAPANGQIFLAAMQRPLSRAVGFFSASTITAVVSGFLDNSSRDPRVALQLAFALNTADLATCLKAVASYAQANLGVSGWYWHAPQISFVKNYVEPRWPYLHNDAGNSVRVIGTTLSDLAAKA